MIEIYEVHPKTRLRVTTRRPLTTETKHLTAVPTTANLAQESSTFIDTSDFYTSQEDYVFEPTTETEDVSDLTTESSEETTRLYEPTPSGTTIGSVDQTTTEVEVQDSTTESSVSSTEENYVHETADKHSTTTVTPEDIATEPTENNLSLIHI